LAVAWTDVKRLEVLAHGSTCSMLAFASEVLVVPVEVLRVGAGWWRVVTVLTKSVEPWIYGGDVGD